MGSYTKDGTNAMFNPNTAVTGHYTGPTDYGPPKPRPENTSPYAPVMQPDGTYTTATPIQPQGAYSGYGPTTFTGAGQQSTPPQSQSGYSPGYNQNTFTESGQKPAPQSQSGYSPGYSPDTFTDSGQPSSYSGGNQQKTQNLFGGSSSFQPMQQQQNYWLNQQPTQNYQRNMLVRALRGRRGPFGY